MDGRAFAGFISGRAVDATMSFIGLDAVVEFLPPVAPRDPVAAAAPVANDAEEMGRGRKRRDGGERGRSMKQQRSA